MAFNTFPYTNYHDLNLDWILKQLKYLDNKLEEYQADLLTQANAYTDKQLVNSLSEFRTELNAFKNAVDEFEQNINQTVSGFQLQLNAQDRKIDAEITGVKAYTDQRITQNTAEIFDIIGTQLIDIKVVNYFTGAVTTLQDMLNYLALFHLQNAITYAGLADKRKTYSEIAALNITYTQLAINGNILIV